MAFSIQRRNLFTFSKGLAIGKLINIEQSYLFKTKSCNIQFGSDHIVKLSLEKLSSKKLSELNTYENKKINIFYETDVFGNPLKGDLFVPIYMKTYELSE